MSPYVKSMRRTGSTAHRSPNPSGIIIRLSVPHVRPAEMDQPGVRPLAHHGHFRLGKHEKSIRMNPEICHDLSILGRSETLRLRNFTGALWSMSY